MAHTETREERVAGLVRSLSLVAKAVEELGPSEAPSSQWLLTTVEALAGLEWVSNSYCPSCGSERGYEHLPECTVGLAAEAWRRFTAKGEHE